jgi:hypothetical protein
MGFIFSDTRPAKLKVSAEAPWAARMSGRQLCNLQIVEKETKSIELP